MMSSMSYDDFVDALAERVEDLLPRRKAAMFWVAGTALEAELGDVETDGWASWFRKASDLSLRFILDGSVGDAVREVWEQASADSGSNPSQLFQSIVICLSSPLAIAIEPDRSVGPWIEHALFPLVGKISLSIFGDVVFPDDDGLEEVFADDRFQAAEELCMSLCTRLKEDAQLDRESLAEMVCGASVLNG
jgi:hypothetical protein